MLDVPYPFEAEVLPGLLPVDTGPPLPRSRAPGSRVVLIDFPASGTLPAARRRLWLGRLPDRPLHRATGELFEVVPFAVPRTRPLLSREAFALADGEKDPGTPLADTRPTSKVPPERFVALCAVGRDEAARQFLDPDGVTGAYGEFTRGVLRALGQGEVTAEGIVRRAAERVVPERTPNVHATESGLLTTPIF